MSLVLIVYILGLVGEISGALSFFGFISAVIAVVGGCMAAAHFDSRSETDQRVYEFTKRNSIRGAIAFVVLCAINTILPSEKTAYVMVAAYGVEGVLESEEAQRLGGKSLQVIESYLDEKLAEFEEEVVESVSEKAEVSN